MTDEELLKAIRQIVKEEITTEIKNINKKVAKLNNKVEKIEDNFKPIEEEQKENQQATKTLSKVKDIIEDHYTQEKDNLESFLANYEIEVDETVKHSWTQLLELVENKLSKPSFDTWFSEVELVANNDNKLIFLVENDFQADWLETRYLDMLEESMKELTGEHFEFVFSAPSPEIIEKIKKQ